jgi:putative DNA primase/helicase
VVTKQEQAVRDYLDAIFPNGSSGYFVSAYLTKQRTNGSGKYEGNFHEISGQWPQDRERLVSTIIARAETDDAYITPYLRDKPSRAKDKSVALPSHVLRCDLDGRTIREDEADELGAMVIGSGRGSHVYVQLVDALEPDDLERWNQRLCAYLGAGAEKWEANAVLRPAGTLNHKPRVLDDADPVRVRMSRASSKSWTLEELDKLLPDVRQDAASDAEPLEDLDVDSLPPIIRVGLKEEPGENRSAQTASFVRDCVAAGLDEATTIAAVLQHRPTLARGKTRDWIIQDARRLLKKTKSEEDDGLLPNPAQAYEVARIIHREVWDEEKLARVGGIFWTWTGTHWREPHPDALAGSLYRFLEGKSYSTKNGATKYPTTAGKVSDIRAALAALAIREQEQAARGLVPFQNGHLDIETGKLYPHSPAYFNTYVVDMDWTPNVRPSRLFRKYLHDVWEEDGEQAKTLLEWTGYVLSGRTDLQRALLWHGPPRGGKGVYGRRLDDIYGGSANVAAPTLSALGERFGLQSAIGKPLLKIADARLGGHKESGLALERLLAIIGEDVLDVDRKNRDPWTGRLPTRIMLLTNELLRVRDNSGAFVARLLVLQSEASFLGREDRGLDLALQRELPGIVRMSLDAYGDLVARGDFLQPNGGYDALTMLRDMSAPVQAMVRDYCVLDPERSETKDALWKAWKYWCDQTGFVSPGDRDIFFRDLYAAYPRLRSARLGGREGRGHYVQGIGLRSDTLLPDW